MLVGGDSPDVEFDVEIIDLTNENRVCQKPINCPLFTRSSGIYKGDKPIICGGYGNVSPQDGQFCYNYNRDQNIWEQSNKMFYPRYDNAIVDFSDLEFWIIGENDFGAIEGETCIPGIPEGGCTIKSELRPPVDSYYQPVMLKVQINFFFIYEIRVESKQ